ncbi:hypothetical protein AAG570_004958 [Ranatra chinensis]|uniref:DDB1- and CUL4-associated factor 15 WD40 repeat-containing domain-containing protein n=1 Tax=Ranatra chinensis TaxID=642074 RepID=A0ABD0XZ36_9HEMI
MLGGSGWCVVPDYHAKGPAFDSLREMAANWDSGVGLTCLKHGLTLHTSFSVPYPYDFDPEVCAAVDDRVVINTGSFLHVLAFSIEKNGPTPSTPPPRTGPPTIVNAPLENRLGYSFLRDNGYSVFLSDTWACNMTQMLIDHIQQGHQVEVRELPFFLKLAIQKHVQSLKQSKSSPRPGSDSVITSLTEVSRRTSPPAGGRQQKWFSSAKTWRLTGLATAAVAAQGGGGGKPSQGTGKRPAEQVYDFEDSDEVGCEPKFKLYRRRCLADKMYEFRSDEDENIRPRPAVSSPLRQQRQASPPPPGSPNRQPDSVHKRQPIFFRCNVPTPEKVRNSLKLYDMHTDSETEEDSVPAPVAVVMSPNTGVGLRADINKVVRAIIADWESPEPELLGGAQSPPQPTSAAESRHSNVVAFVSSLLEGGKLPGAVQQAATRQRHRQRHHRRHTWSALKPTNRDLGDKPKQTVKSDQFELTDLMRREMERGFGHQPVTGCSVQFTRRYIEIDQEITSTITEIEVNTEFKNSDKKVEVNILSNAFLSLRFISIEMVEGPARVERKFNIGPEYVISYRQFVNPDLFRLSTIVNGGVEVTNLVTLDDEIGPGFQCALPLSVHGSAYAQMEMISNQKAEKLILAEKFLQAQLRLHLEVSATYKVRSGEIWLQVARIGLTLTLMLHVRIASNIGIGSLDEVLTLKNPYSLGGPDGVVVRLVCSTAMPEDWGLIPLRGRSWLKARLTSGPFGVSYVRQHSAYMNYPSAPSLNMMCAVVTQSTLDIEHFCYKAAESICKMEGFKFWFCSDYDTEVINMCPATEDMLFVVFIRLNAEDLRLTNPNAQTNKFYLRNFYECSCVCIWSAARGVCYLEGYSGLRRAPTAAPKPWSPAGKEATALRAAAHGRHFGTNQTQPRSFVHRVRDGQIVGDILLFLPGGFDDFEFCGTRKAGMFPLHGLPFVQYNGGPDGVVRMSDHHAKEPGFGLDKILVKSRIDLWNPECLVSKTVFPLSLIVDHDNLIGFKRK